MADCCIGGKEMENFGISTETRSPQVRIGWGERSDAQHLACAKRKPFQGSGIRNQETGIRSISGGFAAGVTKPHREYHPTVGARRAVPDQGSGIRRKPVGVLLLFPGGNAAANFLSPVSRLLTPDKRLRHRWGQQCSPSTYALLHF
jgi:hypothetical protein